MRRVSAIIVLGAALLAAPALADAPSGDGPHIHEALQKYDSDAQMVTARLAQASLIK